MWFFVILKSCIQLAFIKGSEIKSPPSWKEVDNACFLWPDVAKSWANAEKYCNDENSHLASISNQETHDYIRSRVRTTDSTTFFWIGGTDKDQERHWTWRYGSTWNFSQWSTQPVIQPDNYKGNEDCLQIYHENTEEGRNDYVCEKKIKPNNFVKMNQNTKTTPLCWQ